jgi:fructosamine-3-kinase
VIDALGRACGSAVVASRPVPGGDINRALRAELADGRVLFVKHGAAAPGDFYEAEAAGLRWLADARALPVPVPVAVAEDFLALEWVDAEPRAARYEEILGRGLAALHRAGAERFGTDGPTYLGSLRVPNAAAPDWPAFYGEQRLAPLLRMAVDARALPDGAAARVERVITRLGELCGDPEPPARLHGDLWSGNVMAGPGGAPWLVDPAAYGGHREVDLAMLRLFGSPGRAFFAAYEEVAPLSAGHEQRVELYQLLPLLVHAVLFGGGYGASVARAASRYA